MNKRITLVFPALLAAASTVLAQSPEQNAVTTAQPPAVSAPPAAASQPLAAVASPAVQAPALAAYEERLKAAEDRFPRKSLHALLRNDIHANPWLAYVGAYERVMEAKAKSGDTATAGAPEVAPARGGPVGGLPTVAAFVASDMAPIGSAARTNWAYAGLGLALLDLLSSSVKQQSTAQWIAEARHTSLMLPGIHFFKQEPKAFDGDNGYRVIRDAHPVITGLGMECNPALFHAPAESTAYIGGASNMPSYFRMYACGFGPNETLGAQDKVRNAEIKALMLMGYKDADPVLRLSLSNLPAMSHMKRVLGVTDEAVEKNMGRLAYERVRDKVPADWTVVYMAPSESGKWTVYVARNGVVEAFDAPEKL